MTHATPPVSPSVSTPAIDSSTYCSEDPPEVRDWNIKDAIRRILSDDPADILPYIEDGPTVRAIKEFSSISTQGKILFFQHLSKNEADALERLTDLSTAKGLEESLSTRLKQLISTIHNAPSLAPLKRLISYMNFNTDLAKLIQQVEIAIESADLEYILILYEIQSCLQMLAASVILSHNAHETHLKLLKWIQSKPKSFPFGDFEDLTKLEHHQRLEITWERSSRIMEVLGMVKNKLINKPNITYELCLSSGEPLKFFRMPSPESHASTPMPIEVYKGMLHEHHRQRKRHFDLSLLRLEKLDNEVNASKERISLQESFPDTLSVFCYDILSDFSMQKGTHESFLKKNYSELKKAFLNELLNENFSTFVLPSMLTSSTQSLKEIEYCLDAVHEDFFKSQENLDIDKVSSFIDLSVIYILEMLLEKIKPTTCNLSCMLHFDRGMMFSNLLYYYLMVKNGLHESKEHLDYMDAMTFGPVVLCYKRSPDKEMVKRFLKTLSIMEKPEAVEKVRQRKTYFTDSKLMLPPLVEPEGDSQSLSSVVTVESNTATNRNHLDTSAQHVSKSILDLPIPPVRVSDRGESSHQELSDPEPNTANSNEDANKRDVADGVDSPDPGDGATSIT